MTDASRRIDAATHRHLLDMTRQTLDNGTLRVIPKPDFKGTMLQMKCTIGGTFYGLQFIIQWREIDRDSRLFYFHIDRWFRDFERKIYRILADNMGLLR